MPYGRQNERIAIVGIVVTLGFMMLATSAFAPPPNDSIIDPRVFPPSSTPFGMFYGEWAAEWWQWNFTIPGNYPGRLRVPMQSAFTAFLRKG